MTTVFCERLTEYALLLLEAVGAVLFIFLINLPLIIWHYWGKGFL